VNLDTDFKIVGDCIVRPRGLRRVLLDGICRLTGHLLWRNQHTEYLPPDGSLPVSTSHCRRCYRWGYVEADYRPRPVAPQVFVLGSEPVSDDAIDAVMRRVRARGAGLRWTS
jgi:hypothetical protein